MMMNMLQQSSSVVAVSSKNMLRKRSTITASLSAKSLLQSSSNVLSSINQIGMRNISSSFPCKDRWNVNSSEYQESLHRLQKMEVTNNSKIRRIIFTFFYLYILYIYLGEKKDILG